MSRVTVGTSRVITSLLHRLAATTDPAQTLRLLAGAELARENAIYAAHLATAETLAGILRGRNWQVLDQLAASGDDPEGAAIIAVLRRAARHDEHEIPLAEPLRKADRDALDLIMSRTKSPPPNQRQPPNRFRASEVPAVLEQIREAAAASPDAMLEITWRVVTG